MPADATSDPKFDLGHVLFIDIVGYSKLTIGEQSELLGNLNQIVQATSQFKKAETEGSLIRLPTGDGMALVFTDTPESPVRCAIEISSTLRQQPKLPVRMGIHSGPVNRVRDVNGRDNIAGAGINMAQRVMDCGDAGHILLSKHVAEDLEHYARWQPLLHDLGQCEVKHGVRTGIVSLHNEEIGNEIVPRKIEEGRQAESGPAPARRKPTWRTPVTASLLLLAAGLVFLLLRNQSPRSTEDIPVKSIAVLPFENLSGNAENAFFADGVQDEILTDLSRIADLKVISRTSVMQYKGGTPRNAKAIGAALNVAHLLEGNVQRANGKVRVNVQLIDARKDAHVWAQTFDRDLADVFGIQSEIAKAIADQLRAKLSPSEKAEIDRRPTSSEAAFDLYIQAKTILVSASSSDPEKARFLEAVELLNQAVQRDPEFFLAYCQLVHAHAELYFYNFDHTPSRSSLAEAALQNAARLRPNAGETHLARAEYLYRCQLDYDHARSELIIAARELPNNSRVYALTGFIDRRQGRWEEAISNLEKGVQLDPRNVILLQQIAASYPYLRRYEKEAAALDRLLALNPEDLGIRVSRAFVDLELHANVQPYRDAVHSIVNANPDGAADVAGDWFQVCWYDRNATEATRAAAVIPAEGAGSNAVRFPRAWYEGLAAHLRQDEKATRDSLSRARTMVEREVQDRPNYGPPLCVLGMIDAALGRKEDAMSEGRRAVELLPMEQDSINGSHLVMYLAMIYASAGEKDLAIEQLNLLLSKPGDGSYGDFQLNPFWDPLKGDPRFEKLVSSLAPKG